MKRFLSRLGSVWIFAATSVSAATRDAEWRHVEDAANQGLPKTAIERLEPIIAGALQDQAWGEAAQAIARKIVLEGNIAGNKPEEKITRLEAEIAQAPAPIVPLLDTLLANWYWQYFQNNRWRFLQRAQTAQPPGHDFTTWDLPRIYAEIDGKFQKALANADVLKRTPVAEFGELLPQGTFPDTYRPTLYDFIVQEALKFYSSGEPAGAKPEDAFEIPAGGPIFGTAQEFLAWNPNTTETDSPKLRAVRLYQDLLRFHREDANPTAFLDANLTRLTYGYNLAFGEEKHARYKAALKAFTDEWADHEVSAMALYQWARVLEQEGDLVQARDLAQRAANAHRTALASSLARNLVRRIEAKSYDVETERVWNAPWPTIRVQYRNITDVHFRAVAYDWDAFLDGRRNPDNLSDAERRQLLLEEPALTWSATLPPTPDYKERVQELPAPETLQPGFYFVIASANPDFTQDDNQMIFADVWVSDLALVIRSREGGIEGFVLEANSGEPVVNAEVSAWYLNRTGNRLQVPTVRSDANGFFKVGVRERRMHLLRVQHDGRALVTEHEYWPREQRRLSTRQQTVFFTDRALYRPGQTVQYQGICLEADQENNDYEALAGQQLTVVFEDVNGKEIARAEHQCNDYGSFSGSFTAPRNRLMGPMRIRSLGPAGTAQFNVEEYKRPQFQVTLDAPKTAAKLNDQVSLQGKAENYTGAPVDGGQVKWRVVREVRWPSWWGWDRSWRVRGVQASQEIAHGTATTETDGAFTIDFAAKPDPQVSEEDEASFSFSIYADVTDSAGETRSAQRTIDVGFAALQATLSVDDWQTDKTPVALNIRTTTLDDESQAAEGSVKVFRLKEPDRVHRPYIGEISSNRPGATPENPDRSDPVWWELGDLIEEKGFTTDAGGATTLSANLNVGIYRALLETQDRFGKKVTAQAQIRVLNPDDAKLAIKVPHLLAAPRWSVEPGEEFTAVWGTGYDTGRAFVEIEHRQQMLQRFWTQPGRTQQQIKVAVNEALRGGFTVHITQVRENRAYLESRRVDVPWSTKELDLAWEHFTSKLGPGQKETWTAVIKPRNPESGIQNSEKAAAEMVAALYDQSLDQFMPHNWLPRFSVFYQDFTTANASFENRAARLQWLRGQWSHGYQSVDLRYREFPADLTANLWGFQAARIEPATALPGRGVEFRGQGFGRDAFFAGRALALDAAKGETFTRTVASLAEFDRQPERKDSSAANRPDLAQVTARRNLSETAFFFPHLTSDTDGVVRMTFTMPEGLTTWRFLGFAHDRNLRSGFLEGTTVTSKDLMVQPNPPRFVREGDVLEFTVKVSNQSAARQTGRIRLTFSNAMNGESADQLLNVQPVAASRESAASPSEENGGAPRSRRHEGNEIDFDVPSKESRSYSWRITVPDGAPFLTYKAVASTGRLSDGEEGYLPVLSRRVLVTESLALPIRGPATKTFEFEKLMASGQSQTLQHQSFTVQMVSNPAWYAVMALPYLMEYPHECTEQTFNRLYANALARSIANSDPKIRRVFDQWKGTEALDSPLEKNEDLKAVLLEETPWLRQAESESQARQNVGILFDENRLHSETERTLQKLADQQLPDGSWPWFPGGPGNDYITLYITTGFGRLRHLGADIPTDAAMRSLDRLDAWIEKEHREILKQADPKTYVPSHTICLYLYGRSFFLKDQPVAPAFQQGIDFFLARSREHWLDVANRQSQGHLALALHRWGGDDNRATARGIMRSIKERSVTNEESGMFWRETEMSWWWYRAPIETQALMIEAFDEVMSDAQAVEECRVWLLKQKQTQDWKTTKATADAVYALLLRGKDILGIDRLVEVSVGGVNVTPTSGRGTLPRAQGNDGTRGNASLPSVEPGTGFYERRFAAADVKPRLGEITVRKTDEGVAWGSVHWQYLEDISAVTPHEGTPLKLKKSIFTKVNTAQGPTLEPVKGSLNVGDELVVRIELRVDRDMEYIHLKDQRGGGTEPVNVLSRYKYQDGLAYYESTRDTASHFFIDYLPKGAYVFEYSTRIQLRGEYQTGLAEIQCIYAPEFNSHSESLALRVN